MIHEDEKIKKILMMNWGSPTESMIASALSKDHPRLTFTVDTPEGFEARSTQDPKQMISAFEILTHQSLNHYYFHFDSTSRYQVLRP